ncbi:MAG: four-carbon acid sugar kinase family protein [Chloroflexota bacterium]|nr:four-carbon acid sugar kinase family protein [Chloroflexota bacterium]
MQLGIIADDLTGAMDTGLQFSKRGLETLVALDRQDIPDAKVVVVDTDSRAVRASQARERMLAVASQLQGRLLYKKVDSTMRGNVGYELRALLEAVKPRGIVVAPAFPQGGRTTRWGYQRVDGQPLHLTFFADDPRWPMREAHLPTLLMQQAGLEVGHVGLGEVEAGPAALAQALETHEEPVIVVDALTKEHLDSIAQALVSLGRRWLPCGSAGLADAWARALPVRQESTSIERPPINGPVLFVSGSRNDVTTRQLSRLRCARAPRQVEMDPQGVYDAEREIQRLAEGCRQGLERGEDVVVTSSFSPLVAGAGEIVVRILSETVMHVVNRQDLGGLFLTGGDIAVGTCRALDVRALRILEEIQPGIPGGRLVGGRCDGLWVVTKAGGFGDEDALLQITCYLHGEDTG